MKTGGQENTAATVLQAILSSCFLYQSSFFPSVFIRVHPWLKIFPHSSVWHFLLHTCHSAILPLASTHL